MYVEEREKIQENSSKSTINATKEKWHNESSSYLCLCVRYMINPKRGFFQPDVEALKIFGDWNALLGV